MTKKQSKATRAANAQRAAERAAAIRREQEAKERRRRTLTVTFVVIGVLAALLAIGFAVQSGRDTTGQSGASPQGVVNKYALPYGESSAPVKVAVYEDFMCPFCGQFESASSDLLKSYVDRGDIQVQYHVIAFLDRASAGSEFSTRAMNAVGVVLDTSGPEVAKSFHDLLYENQPQEGTTGLSDDQLIDLAVQAGANKDEVSQPIRDRDFEQWVKNATDASSKAGVSTTPTVMVDGKVVEFDSIDGLLKDLQATIDKNLAG